MTNYEHIKAMSLEEMAKHITYICKQAKKTQPENLMCLDSNNCYRCLKHYLESENEVENV